MDDLLVWAIPRTGNEYRDRWRMYELACLWMRHRGDDHSVGLVFTGGRSDDEFLSFDVRLKESESLWTESAAMSAGWRSEDSPERKADLKEMPYREYLLTKEWRVTRTRKLESVGYACQLCNASGVQLDVHHRTYERRGAEADNDLTVLCHSCHEMFHANRKLSR